MERSRYENENHKNGHPIESRLIRLTVVLFILVVCIQVLLRFDGPRRFLNRSIRLEGEELSQSVDGLGQDAYPWLEWPPPDASSDPLTWATLYLRFLGSPPKEAWVLVNGRVAKQLGEEGGTVTVREGDSVQVYSPSGEISVVISAATENLASPAIGTWLVGRGTVEIGEVRLLDPAESR